MMIPRSSLRMTLAIFTIAYKQNSENRKLVKVWNERLCLIVTYRSEMFPFWINLTAETNHTLISLGTLLVSPAPLLKFQTAIIDIASLSRTVSNQYQYLSTSYHSIHNYLSFTNRKDVSFMRILKKPFQLIDTFFTN